MHYGRDIAAVFDDSYEGLLSVVYAHYYDKLNPVTVVADKRYQQALDTEYLFIPTEYEKAAKVQNAIRNKISADAEQQLYYTFLADGEERYFDMYRYILLGFKVGADVDRYEQIDYVLRIHKLSKYVGGEAHLLKGFCRFAETEGGVYYAKISPVNNVLPILAEHFIDRLMCQQWLIHDTNRNIAAVYDGHDYLIDDVPTRAYVRLSDDEKDYQGLWSAFFTSIAVTERKNKKLQRNNLPMRFRKNITEFQIRT